MNEVDAWSSAVQLLSSPSTEAVVRKIAETACGVMAASAALVLMPDRSGGFAPGAAVGLDSSWPHLGLAAARALAGQAADAREIVWLYERAGREEPLPQLVGALPPGMAYAAPLQVEGTLLGILLLLYAAPRDHLPTGKSKGIPIGQPPALLRSFAALAAHALANAAAHARAATLHTRMEALDEASRVLAADFSQDSVLQRIVTIAAAIAGARYAALGVAGEDGYLRQFITTGLSAEERTRIGALPSGHGLLGVLIRLGRPLRIAEIGADPRHCGFPPDHPPMSSLLGVPIRVKNKVVGDLYLTEKIGAPEFSEEDQQLVEMLAAHAGIAIENTRLHTQARELTTLRERERIGRDLHDGIIQNIYAATLQLESLSEDLPDPAERDRLLGIADRLSEVITEVRTYIMGLRTRELEGRSLSEGIEAVVRETDERRGPAITFSLEGAPFRVHDELAHTLVQITRESLANVIKHAQAGRVEVSLFYQEDGIRLAITDDGRGFDPDAPRGEEHRGLGNLRSRAQEAGGSLNVHSAPGQGTTISAFVPMRR